LRRLRVTGPATRDIDAVLEDSENRFGVAGADAYRALLTTAFLDLRISPARPTVKGRPGTPATLRFYHLRHSRSRAPERIGRPRHLILFRDDGETVEILRVLHDAMDIFSRLGDDA
jgi:toxin ParE1/3/4